jgi:uncharacterized membrane protein
MFDLGHLFSYVCGQVNNWAPGGELLPFCQRCTGLYVGGALAAGVSLFTRPRATPGKLWLHSGLLLLMVPFGYHLVPQGETLRTLTGQLFGYGLVYVLLLVPANFSAFLEESESSDSRVYALLLLAGVPLLQLAVRFGASAMSVLMAWIGFTGLLAYATLAIANVIVVPIAIRRRFRSEGGTGL